MKKFTKIFLAFVLAFVVGVVPATSIYRDATNPTGITTVSAKAQYMFKKVCGSNGCYSVRVQLCNSTNSSKLFAPVYYTYDGYTLVIYQCVTNRILGYYENVVRWY